MTYIQEDIVASDTEPATIVDGMTWIDTSGNNVEFHHRINGSWETGMARGPDTPEHPVEGSLWRDTANGVLKQYDGASFGSIGTPPQLFDSAETFAESDVTISHTKTEIVGGSVQLQSDSSTGTQSTQNNGAGSGARGVKISPNSLVTKMDVTLMDGTDISYPDVTDWQITRISDSTTVYSDSGLSVPSGTTFTINNIELDPNETYYFTVENGALIPYQTEGVSYPISTSVADITAGVSGGGIESTSTYQAFASIKFYNLPPNGETIIEWPYPTDVYDWGSVYYNAVDDGETVEVYAEEDDGGWTEIAGPLSRGEEIPADSANNVRFRVDLSRSNTSNNPRLESINRGRYL